MKDAFYEGTTPFGTLAQFASFGIAAAGFLVLLRMLHGRGFWSLIGPAQAAWRDFVAVGAMVGFWLLVIELLPPRINYAEVSEMRDIGLWLSLIPVALVVLLIQVGTEEIFFRGYLQQQFACLSRSKWVWMVFPSVLFGALHYWNGEDVVDGFLWAAWAASLGLACADLTARTGNLGAAIGLHLVNNAFAILLEGIEGWPGSGLALFLYPYFDPQEMAFGAETLISPWVVVSLLGSWLFTLVMWLAARVALKR
jgi:membrane protease YdiL (CAAX protease family)